MPSVCHSEHLRILSRPEWVEPVVMFLKDKALAAGAIDADTAQRLVICFTEAITNAIVHGNYELSSDLKEQGGEAFRKALDERKAEPGYAERIVDVRVDYEPDRCTWTITDQGKGFDVQKVLDRLNSDDPEVILASGRGISIMQAFVSEVAWDQGGRQIRLTLETQAGSERRTSQRRKYTATIGLTCADGTTLEAVARDLSDTGIAFITTQPLDQDTRVTVALDLGRDSEHTLTGRIVRCNAIADPFYDVAVHFEA
jgi:anti-sigma regulatory factor (Ser/Thr protein kinase)